MPSPSEATLSRLSDMVVEKKYDLGIGTDGDADRLGIIDEKGHYIHPNKVMVLLYYYLIKYKKWQGDVVRNIATTHQLDAIANSFNYKCHEVPVGFKHVSGMMQKTNALIGGESSGGLTIKGHVKGKDGIFAAGLLVEMMSVTGKGLGEMIRGIDEIYGSFEMAEANFVFSEELRQSLMTRLFTEKEVPDFSNPIDHVSYLDGVKVYFENGDWIIARFSGTEPLIRIFSESNHQENAEAYIQTMKNFLGL
jgi:phosphomannomutase